MTQESIFSIGTTVQVIDHDEIPSEWATFVITYRFLFFYRLSRVNSANDFSFWVNRNEIDFI